MVALMQAKTKLIAFVDQEKPDVMQFIHTAKPWWKKAQELIGKISLALFFIFIGYLMGRMF